MRVGFEKSSVGASAGARTMRRHVAMQASQALHACIEDDGDLPEVG